MNRRSYPAIAPRPSAVGGTVEQEHSSERDVAPIGADVQGPRALPVGLHFLRHRIDLICGVFVLVIASVGCLSVGLVRRQRYDLQLFHALYEQVQLVDILSRGGDGVTPPRAHFLRLLQNLQTLQTGGDLIMEDKRFLRVEPLRDPSLHGELDTTLSWMRRDAHLPEAERLGMPPTFAAHAPELSLLIRAVAAHWEHRSLASVLHISTWQFGLMFGWVGMFLLSVLFLRYFLTTPLRRMADGIEAMQRTGRLVKLPARYTNELGIVASGFNQLAQQVEDQKQRLRDHIMELQRMNAELDRLANLKDDFLMTINHQLRTPLATVTEGINLIRDGAMGHLTEDQHQLIQMMQDNAGRLTKLIEDLLDLSLLKSGRRPLRCEAGDLSPILNQCQTNWQTTSSHAIRVASEHLPQVYMDAQAIREIMNQLLRNALRHSPQHAEILVKADRLNGYVEVSVHNAGPALAREDLSRLFEPFVHLETPEAPGSRGSGLGLAFCRQLIERQRGSIRAESLAGQGTTLIFTLPVATPGFLFQEACRQAHEEADYDRGQFGVLMVQPIDPGLHGTEAVDLMHLAEQVLRQNTHRGDQFVWLDEMTLAIVAVTDEAGLQAMKQRLQGILGATQTAVRLSGAVFPVDAQRPEELLAVARQQGLSVKEPCGAMVHQPTEVRG